MRKHLAILLFFVFSISLQAQIANANNDLPQKPTKAILEEKDQRMYKSSQLDIPLYYKSLFVAVYQLDSMVSKDYDEYDSAWYHDDLDVLLYNADKQCITEIDFDFDQGNNRDTSDIYWYTYDVNGNLIQEIGAYWDNGLWDTSWKEVYTYNAANQYTTMIEYDYSNGLWEKYWKSEYTYDVNGYLIKREYFDWDNNAWEPYSKQDYVNYADGRIEFLVGQYKNGSSYQFDDSTYFTYNSNLQLTEELRFNWNYAFWETYHKYTYTYYTTGNLETRTSYYDYNSSWDTSYRYHYIYNTQGFLTERVELDWNDGIWENEYKDVYTYDMNYSVPLITASPYYLDDISDMLLTEFEFMWDENNGVWEGYNQETLFWSHTGLSVAENPFNAIKIYPIPAKDKIHIELSTFEPTTVRLVDINGRQMQEKKMNSTQETLHIEGYASGLYFLIIERKGNTAVQKVVIQ